jgi:hypothetical protein
MGKQVNPEKCVTCEGTVFVKYPPDIEADPYILHCANIDCADQRRKVVVPADRSSYFKVIFDRREY